MRERNIGHTALAISVLLLLSPILVATAHAQSFDEVIFLSDHKRHFIPFAYGGLARNITVAVDFSSTLYGRVYVHLLAYEENDAYVNGSLNETGWRIDASLYDGNGTTRIAGPSPLKGDRPTPPVAIDPNEPYRYVFDICVPAGLEVETRYHLYFVIGLDVGDTCRFYGAEYNPTALYDVYLYPIGDYFIKGRVISPAGDALPGAEISVTNSRSGETLRSSSDANGSYVINIGDFSGGFAQDDILIIRSSNGDLTGEAEVVLDLNGYSEVVNITLSRSEDGAAEIDRGTVLTVTFLIAALALLIYFTYLGRDAMPGFFDCHTVRTHPGRTDKGSGRNKKRRERRKNGGKSRP